MLTVRHVAPNGTERVFEVVEVLKMLEPNPNPQTNDDVERTVIAGVDSSNTHHMIVDGSVYVMNSSGKTVAVYGLTLGNAGAGQTR